MSQPYTVSVYHIDSNSPSILPTGQVLTRQYKSLIKAKAAARRYAKQELEQIASLPKNQNRKFHINYFELLDVNQYRYEIVNKYTKYAIVLIN